MNLPDTFTIEFVMFCDHGCVGKTKVTTREVIKIVLSKVGNGYNDGYGAYYDQSEIISNLTAGHWKIVLFPTNLEKVNK